MPSVEIILSFCKPGSFITGKWLLYLSCSACKLFSYLYVLMGAFSPSTLPTDRRFIQQPIAAPPVSKVTTNKSSYSYSTKDIQHSDSDNYRYNSVSITKDSHSSNITRDSSRNEIQLPSSPSRSRNATRELICKYCCGDEVPPTTHYTIFYDD